MLIGNGLFSRTRNPNYLGEMMIYWAFALLTNHIISYLIMLWAQSIVFTTNIIKKELRLKQKAGYWEHYNQQSNVLIPKLFGYGLDHALWALFVIGAAYVSVYPKN